MSSFNDPNNINNCFNNESNNNNVNGDATQNIALFLQLLSNPTILQQMLAAITQNSQHIAAQTFSESTQTLSVPSSAIVRVVNTSVSNLLFIFKNISKFL